MFNRHPTHRMAAYGDGQLPPREAQSIEAHLATCASCRRDCDDIRFAGSLLQQLAVSSPPAEVWQAIDRQLAARQPWRRLVPRWQLAMAAGVVLLAVTSALYWRTRPATETPWQVALQSAGSSEQLAQKAVGDWVATSGASRARIVVGTIGKVTVEPNARVQLGAVTGSQYRLALERGTISAEISAPPRMFIVDTPATTVVDLGCAYTVTVAPDGAMELHMTSGWAALDWRGSETLVPAGAMSRTRKGQQPGIPYFEDAPAALQQAINTLGAEGPTGDWLAAVLPAARERDTLTLWHLLSRTATDQRTRVLERLMALVPLPTGVQRDDLLRLDPDTLRKYREELAWHW